MRSVITTVTFLAVFCVDVSNGLMKSQCKLIPASLSPKNVGDVEGYKLE